MTDVKKVLIVGAGNIGQAIFDMLAFTLFWQPTLADGSKVVLDKVDNIHIEDKDKLVLDAHDTDTLKKTLEEFDYVINAGPHWLASTIAYTALETSTHYFDLTEDIEQTNLIREYAKKAENQAFVPQCGLAPGFIGIVANDVAKHFNKVLEVKMRVGALPQHPNNALKYNMTWSTDGLVNEYLHGCNAVKNGKLVDIQPLEGYELLGVDGDEYEAFNTSGGLGTLCETWDGEVNNMDYKTIRYVGHRDLIKFLLDDLKLGIGLIEIMDKAIPTTKQDVVLVFVSVSGFKDGRLVQETWTKKIYSQEIHGKLWTAIQLTTAAGICGMVELHRTGKLPQTGFVRQEDADFNDFMETSFGSFYK